MTLPPGYIAFADDRRIASGALAEVAREARRTLDQQPDAQILIFNDRDSRQAEVDLRGTPDEVVARLESGSSTPAPAPRGRGRPKLGVVAREVTLLPRHWEWLGHQPGGASAMLRRLVEDARRGNGDREKARQSGEAVDRFMHVMAGNREGFEDALRAFYRREREAFRARIADWPEDIRAHIEYLAAAAWDDKADTQ